MSTRYIRIRFSSILIALGVFAGAGILRADEVSAMWERIYGRARSIEQRVEVMTNVVERHDPVFIPFLTGVLEEINTQWRQITSTTERIEFQELTRLVVREMGELKASDGAQQIFEVIKSTEDPRLKSEAILALGKVGDPSYADDVATFLQNINLNIGVDNNQEAEVLALSCVLSLERFREPIGFTPLFFATIGWYSGISGVKQQASRVLQSLLDDPSEILRDLVILEESFGIKLAALEAEDRSTAPPDGKSLVALAALEQGLLSEPRNINETTTLAQLRLKALEVLIENESHDEDAPELFEELLQRRIDINETLTVLSALSVNRVDEAIRVLTRYLEQQNQRQSSGVVPDDYRIVRATIQALGNAENPLATEELTMVRHSDWPPAVVREANAALEKLQ